LPRDIEDVKMDRGVFKNPDAVDLRTLKAFAKLRSDILKVASEKSLITEVTVDNPLAVEHGLIGKIYDWGQLVALKKSEGVPTGVQHVKPGSIDYQLEQHEVKVGITDEGKINSTQSAQDILSAGQAGMAFARSIDSQCFNEFVANSNGTTGTNWDTETDVNIRKQLRGAGDVVEDLGFDITTVIMTTGQLERIGRIESIVRGYNTVEGYMNSIFPGAKILTWKQIKYKDEHLVWQTLFNPVGKLMLLDKDAFSVFTQRPTTAEFKRDVDAGVDYAYMRKFFKTKIAQKEAGYLLTGLTL